MSSSVEKSAASVGKECMQLCLSETHRISCRFFEGTSALITIKRFLHCEMTIFHSVTCCHQSSLTRLSISNLWYKGLSREQMTRLNTFYMHTYHLDFSKLIIRHTRSIRVCFPRLVNNELLYTISISIDYKHHLL